MKDKDLVYFKWLTLFSRQMLVISTFEISVYFISPFNFNYKEIEELREDIKSSHEMKFNLTSKI